MLKQVSILTIAADADSSVSPHAKIMCQTASVVYLVEARMTGILLCRPSTGTTFQLTLFNLKSAIHQSSGKHMLTGDDVNGLVVTWVAGKERDMSFAPCSLTLLVPDSASGLEVK